MLNILRLTDLIIVKARSPRSCARLLKWSVPRRALRRVHWSSLTKDNRRSLKRKENWRKSLLLGIQTGDKLAKPPFFVAYSRLCRLLKQSIAYKPPSKRCNLCLWEKYFIICKPHLPTLNHRHQLVSSCRHMFNFCYKFQVPFCYTTESLETAFYL